jgi:hypothetical protein
MRLPVTKMCEEWLKLRPQDLVVDKKKLQFFYRASKKTANDFTELTIQVTT